MDFEEVYAGLYPDVYRYLLALCRDPGLAEELTQETFFQAIQHIGEFQGGCKLYVWLCQIGKNQYFSWRRRRKREDRPEELLESAGLEELLLDRETSMDLHRRLHDLPEPYREVFSLRVFGELSFRQIGELFQRTESWARVTYHRARLKLKEDLL